MSLRFGEYADVTVTYEDGTVVELTEVRMDAYYHEHEDHWGTPWKLSRLHIGTKFSFTTTGPFTVKLPPPETRAEKRARLIREMYPGA